MNNLKKLSTLVKSKDSLPNGDSFSFWQDETVYDTIFHVSQQNPRASDENPGTQELPFKTIQAAASILQPGQKVVVHEGVYRECVRPACGGTAANQMILYEAAPDERVVIKGSEVWHPAFEKSSGWRLDPSQEQVPLVMADMPESFFQAYNPFLARNTYHYLFQYGRPAEPPFMKKAMLYRGCVFIDGQPMKQVFDYRELATTQNAFWVEQPGLRLHLRLPEGVNPAESLFEVTAREQIFAPRQRGLGYIRVKGFAMEHGADGLPVPQRAALSAMRGHHWIIEHNRIEWINACGIDIGGESWDADRPAHSDTNPNVGHHIVRANVITIENISPDEIVRRFQQTTAEEALPMLRHYADHAEQIIESTGEDMVNASRFGTALVNLLTEHNACGGAIACFDLIGRTGTNACLGVAYVNDMTDMFISCEGDMDSAVTMLLMRGITDDKLWMANPCLDASGRVNFSHCTAPWHVGGHECAYVLRHHHESGVGVSLQVTLPPDCPLTLCRISDECSAISIHTGHAVPGKRLNVCRTQMWVQLDDYEHYLHTALGCHQVFAFENVKKRMEIAAQLLDLKIV